MTIRRWKPRVQQQHRSESARHLIEQRTELGYTQPQLAHLLDISPRTLQNYELDARPVPQVVLMAVNFLMHCRRNAEIE